MMLHSQSAHLLVSLTRSATIATRLVTLLVSAEADVDRAQDLSDVKVVTTLARDLHAVMNIVVVVVVVTADRLTDTTEGGTIWIDAMTGVAEVETEDPDLVIATRDVALVTTVAVK